MQLPQKIAQGMQVRGLSREDLAKELGASPGAVANWLRGAIPNRTNRAKLAKLLEIDPNDIATNGEAQAVDPGPISVSIEGEGISLKMMISKLTAATLLQFLVTGQFPL